MFSSVSSKSSGNTVPRLSKLYNPFYFIIFHCYCMDFPGAFSSRSDHMYRDPVSFDHASEQFKFVNDDLIHKTVCFTHLRSNVL